MSRDEIVEIADDPEQVRRARRRQFLRFGVPLFGIVIIALALIGSGIYTERENRAEVLVLSHDFIDTLGDQIHSDVDIYLQPARSAVSNLAAAVPEDPFSDDGRALFERLGRSILHETPQLASLFIGGPDGSFLMVRRNKKGSVDTKLIRPGTDGPVSIWTRRDADGKVTGTEPQPDDRYDPRTRGWYRQAMARDGIAWSEVYTFFTDKVPGITASRLATSPSKTVVGADIYLSSLSDLLNRIQNKARGTLAIADGQGRLVAFHEPDAVVYAEDGEVRTRFIHELELPDLAEAFERIRVEGATRNIVDIDGSLYLFASASLESLIGRDWWLILLAPESSYLGFVQVIGNRGLIASGAIITLAILLAAFLGYQAIGAERRLRAVGGNLARLDDQRRLLDTLAQLSNLADPGDERDLHKASESLIAAEGARRVSIWHFAPDGSRLSCLDAYEQHAQGHTAGAVIAQSDCPDLFAALAQGEFVVIPDVREDPRIGKLQHTYIEAVGLTSLTSIPIVFGDRALGAIWIGDADQETAITSDSSIARSVANMLAPRLKQLIEAERSAGNDENAAPLAAGTPMALPGTEASRHSTSLAERRSVTRTDGPIEQFDNATVLVMRFRQNETLAAQAGESGLSLLGEIATAFECATGSRDIPYVKVLADRLVAVDGFGNDAAGCAERMADAALDIRNQCAALFIGAGQSPLFTIGLDSAPLFGTAIGASGRTYNVWGEAMDVADALAGSADAGTIQVSESTYEQLQESCIFRRRGAYYLANAGEMAVFTLRGRA